MPGRRIRAVEHRRLPPAIVPALVVAALLTPGGAAAQPDAGRDETSEPRPSDPMSTPRKRARAIGREGLALFQQGRWAEAHDRFARAEALVHSPVFVLYMARARRNLGQLLAAQRLFKRLVQESLGDAAPEAWRSAHDDAETELLELKQRIPTLTVTLVPPGRGLELWVDDHRIPNEHHGRALAVDPGTHSVSVRDGAIRVWHRQVALRERDRKRIEASIPVYSSGAARPAPPPRPFDPGRGVRTGGIVLLSIGGAALAVWVGTGAKAIDLDKELEAACTDNVCERDQADRVKQYRAMATTASVFAGLGGVLAGSGLLMVVLAPSPSETPDTDAGLRLRVAPAHVQLSGAF